MNAANWIAEAGRRLTGTFAADSTFNCLRGSTNPKSLFEMAKFIIPVCFLLIALVHTGYSLKCYACDSKLKTECGDPFVKDKIPLNECPSMQSQQESSCLKLVTEDGSAMKTKRYCLMYPKGSKPCEYAASQNKDMKVKECLDCTEDGCNAAGSISTSTYVLVATSIMAIANVFIRA